MMKNDYFLKSHESYLNISQTNCNKRFFSKSFTRITDKSTLEVYTCSSDGLMDSSA